MIRKGPNGSNRKIKSGKVISKCLPEIVSSMGDGRKKGPVS